MNNLDARRFVQQKYIDIKIVQMQSRRVSNTNTSAAVSCEHMENVNVEKIICQNPGKLCPEG